MNYNPLLLTLALCLCIVPFASAAHDYYPENKIVDTNPALSVPDPATYGYVVFNIIAGGAQDKTVWVINKANVNAKPFDCTFNPDKSERAGQNPDYIPIEVPGVGTTGILQYQSGSYTAYLQNGNGNQCERRDFIVGGASSSQATQVVFQGAAVSQLGEVDAGPKSVKRIEICDAMYYPDLKNKLNPTGYGVKRNWANHFGIAVVQDTLQNLVDSGTTSFEVSNSNLGGDPAYGWYKELFVVYVTGEGKCKRPCDWKMQTVDEYSTITF
jgi:hypothetical protein